MASLLRTKYTEEVRSKLKEEFSISNEMAVPQIKKVVG